ncbi:OmpA family protein [Klebsiella pneumoniae]
MLRLQGPDPLRDHPRRPAHPEIVDAANRPMFDPAARRRSRISRDILLAMAETIRQVPNKISISGHTDAGSPMPATVTGNWELSANRANAARRRTGRRRLSGRADRPGCRLAPRHARSTTRTR